MKTPRRYRYRIDASGFTRIVQGPGVKVKVFGTDPDTAILIRDALDLAYEAGRKPKRGKR